MSEVRLIPVNVNRSPETPDVRNSEMPKCCQSLLVQGWNQHGIASFWKSGILDVRTFEIPYLALAGARAGLMCSPEVLAVRNSEIPKRPIIPYTARASRDPRSPVSLPIERFRFPTDRLGSAMTLPMVCVAPAYASCGGRPCRRPVLRCLSHPGRACRYAGERITRPG